MTRGRARVVMGLARDRRIQPGPRRKRRKKITSAERAQNTSAERAEGIERAHRYWWFWKTTHRTVDCPMKRLDYNSADEQTGVRGESSDVQMGDGTF